MAYAKTITVGNTTYDIFNPDDLPETYPPSAHNHDDRYYTEQETDTLLDGKSNVGHTHDDRYYTESETDILLEEKAAVIEESISGPLVTIEDGADGIPVKSLTVAIEPVQDLHGYDAPWPAGGRGNQWDEEWEEGTISNSTGLPSSGDSIRSKNFIPVIPEENYYFVTPVNMNPYLYDSNQGYIGRYGSYIRNTVITIPQNCYYIKIATPSAYGTTYNNDIAVNYPSSVTTYNPYSNICPISGHTGCNIWRTGKNLLKIAEAFESSSQRISITYTESGCISTATGTYGRQGWLFPIVKGSTYTLTFKAVASQELVTGYNNRIYIGNKKDVVSTSSDGYLKMLVLTTTDTLYSYTFTATTSELWLCSYVSTTATDGSITITDFQLELGSTATTYEPYSGTTLSIDWTSSAGTVYGGTLDVTTGVLTVDYAFVELDGSEDEMWSNSNNKYFICNNILPYNNWAKSLINPSDITTYSKIRSNIGLVSSSDLDRNTDTGICLAYGIRFNVPECNVWDGATVESARTYLSSNPLQVTIPLKSPLTYQLTTAEVTTLLGMNNIYADTGDCTLTYRADTKLYIQRLTKPTEDDMIANENIVSGKFFMVGNNLYLSTSAIASGETIIPGTNCTALSLADALNQLNS